MKKLYKADLYQVSKSKGYIKKGEPYHEINGLAPVLKVESGTLVESNELITRYIQEIIVEKISQTKVREVKTGLTFPILNIQPVDDIDNPYSKVYYCFCTGNVHTYVPNYEYGSKLEEITVGDLYKYNQKYPDPSELKRELSAIFAVGEENMNAKLFQEAEFIKIFKKVYEKARQETRAKFLEPMVEKRKVRKLKRQFKQERRNI